MVRDLITVLNPTRESKCFSYDRDVCFARCDGDPDQLLSLLVFLVLLMIIFFCINIPCLYSVKAIHCFASAPPVLLLSHMVLVQYFLLALVDSLKLFSQDLYPDRLRSDRTT